ncbi:MAG TPA: helix-turn-helix domain-containing protein [Acidothermaceae bacterium]
MSGDRRGRRNMALDALAALSEPTRRRVFDFLREQAAPATRDQVAAALDLGRPITAFHLDALAKAGVVEVDFARPAGRRGPGAGRPAKRYRVVAGEIAASLPARRYDLAGQILAAGVRDASQSAGAVDARAATFAAASAKGRELAALYSDDASAAAATPSSGSLDGVCAVLADLGYEPAGEPDDALRLRNCPFHAVVDVEPELVCQMNLHLLEGLLDGLAASDLEAQFAPTPGECCVRVAARRHGHGKTA